jgi:phage-related minor tail protein
VIKGTVSAKDAFRDMANSIISDLTRMLIKKYITDQLFGFVTSAISGTPSATPTGKAIGGSVQRGQAYMVGERGAELFVPSRSGSIVPNDKLSGGAGVVVNQTINLSTGVAQTVRTEVLGMLPQIAEAAKGAVYDARRRGGQFGSAFGA